MLIVTAAAAVDSKELGRKEVESHRLLHLDTFRLSRDIDKEGKQEEEEGFGQKERSNKSMDLMKGRTAVIPNGSPNPRFSPLLIYDIPGGSVSSSRSTLKIIHRIVCEHPLLGTIE